MLYLNSLSVGHISISYIQDTHMCEGFMAVIYFLGFWEFFLVKKLLAFHHGVSFGNISNVFSHLQ